MDLLAFYRTETVDGKRSSTKLMREFCADRSYDWVNPRRAGRSVAVLDEPRGNPAAASTAQLTEKEFAEVMRQLAAEQKEAVARIRTLAEEAVRETATTGSAALRRQRGTGRPVPVGGTPR